MPRKANPWKEAYMRERRRIQSTMRRMEKQGFVYEENYLPAIPKRISERSVKRLQEEYSTWSVKREAKYKVDLETGEVQTAEEYRKQKAEETVRKMRAKRKTKRARRKGQVTEVDLFLARLDEYVKQFAWAHYYGAFQNFIDRAISTHGKWDVAKAISDLWNSGIIPDADVLYDHDKYAEYAYLLGQNLSMRDTNLEDMIEQSAWDYSDQDDY